MKRALLCGVLSVAFAGMFVGCGEETKVQKKESVSTPSGSTTTTTTHTTEKSGKNPPPKP